MPDVPPSRSGSAGSRLVLLLACAAAVAVAASGFGARFGAWDWRAGFAILRYATYAALAMTVVALVALAVPRLRRGHALALGLALVIAAGAAAVPLALLRTAAQLPAINDITTDTLDPPRFVAIASRRADAPVPADYPGEATARQQRASYPDVAPLVLKAAPADVFARALALVQDAGWDVAAVDRAGGRIEATATTPWFGFHDDVVIRIAPSDGGTRVDMRSVSRVGRGDLGANARRIRSFLGRLTAERG